MEKFKVVESTVANVRETELSAVHKHPKMLWPEDQKILVQLFVENGGMESLMYLSTAVGLTPGGSTHLHINNT
jgi:hypothetical protein